MRTTLRRGLGGAAACGVALAAWLAGCSTGSGAEPSPNGISASAPGGDASPRGETTGLPCDVGRVLASRCRSCHSEIPSAPMPLVTWEDLHAPSKSQPAKRVYELAGERLASDAKPMPPAGKLSADEIAVFAAWAKAGAPKSTCASEDALGPKTTCTRSADCPGVLVCRQGTCDVECVADKDCTATWSCVDTRCQPPEAKARPVYNAVSTTAAWATSSLPDTSESYSGTVFDGHYVYFAPQNGGPVLRLDPQNPYSTRRTWTRFDLTGIDARATGFTGAVFDGRFVYLVPRSGTALARYDTRAAYLDPASWTVFDLSTVGSAVGFTGATFDGRYVYFVPSRSSVALRYDSADAITNPNAWRSFAISSIDPAATSFAGAVSVGRYIYFVPSGDASGPRGVVARHDTEWTFTNPTAWLTVDLAQLDRRATGYRTGAFDGRYVYLVPGWSSPAPSWASSTIARYDTTASFGGRDSWTFVDLAGFAANAIGFNAAAFDGQRLLLAPGHNAGGDHGLVLGYDTTQDIALKSSWGAFDLTTLGTSARNMRGASFDGRYVYFAPSLGSAVRFDARPFSAGAPLPVFGGSFY